MSPEFEQNGTLLPRVSEEALERAKSKTLQMTDPKQQRLLVRSMFNKEPNLASALISLEKDVAAPVMFYLGAHAFYAYLTLLEGEGYIFPKANKRVISTLVEEWKKAMIQIKPIVGGFEEGEFSATQAEQMFKEAKRQVEFNFPSPEDYNLENPALMGLISSYSLEEQVGAMLVYESKRRQAGIDRLRNNPAFNNQGLLRRLKFWA